MVPIRGYLARCEKQFETGKVYPLEVREERSIAEHNHYFASIADAFGSLPEKVTDEKIKTPDHLRKWALIETGWFNEVVTDCGSQEIALRMASLTRRLDDYCEIRVRGPLLVVRHAKSQSVHGKERMDKETFRKSKGDVLNLLADMIGVSRTILERYAGRTA